MQPKILRPDFLASLSHFNIYTTASSGDADRQALRISGEQQYRHLKPIIDTRQASPLRDEQPRRARAGRGQSALGHSSIGFPQSQHSTLRCLTL